MISVPSLYHFWALSRVDAGGMNDLETIEQTFVFIFKKKKCFRLIYFNELTCSMKFSVVRAIFSPIDWQFDTIVSSSFARQMVNFELEIRIQRINRFLDVKQLIFTSKFVCEWSKPHLATYFDNQLIQLRIDVREEFHQSTNELRVQHKFDDFPSLVYWIPTMIDRQRLNFLWPWTLHWLVFRDEQLFRHRKNDAFCTDHPKKIWILHEPNQKLINQIHQHCSIEIVSTFWIRCASSSSINWQ